MMTGDEKSSEHNSRIGVKLQSNFYELNWKRYALECNKLIPLYSKYDAKTPERRTKQPSEGGKDGQNLSWAAASAGQGMEWYSCKKKMWLNSIGWLSVSMNSVFLGIPLGIFCGCKYCTFLHSQEIRLFAVAGQQFLSWHRYSQHTVQVLRYVSIKSQCNLNMWEINQRKWLWRTMLIWGHVLIMLNIFVSHRN